MELLRFSFSVAFLTLSFAESPQIKISDGELKGVFLSSRSGRIYSAFFGVPYAKPPKRFQLAEFPDPWTGVKDCSKFGDSCLQKPLLSPKRVFHGSENCLFVNIYVPGKMEKKNLAVMVFIHGGAYVVGSSNLYREQFFMDHDVILVTMNYRLGALGFLSSGDDEVIEANLGLKDQHLALKWIQKNIATFGGDPKQITIFGESAGGASVHYHVLSPLSKDLFQKAILESGVANTPWGFKENNSRNAMHAFELGRALGCQSKSSEELLKCLQGKNAEDIIYFETKKWNNDPILTFYPVKDSPNSKQIFVPESPLVSMEKGNFNKIPILITVCKDEGLFFHSLTVVKSENLTKEINKDWHRILPITLYYDDIGLSEHQKSHISTEVKKFYFGHKSIGEETFTNLTNMYSDGWFIHPVHKTALLFAKHTTVYNAVLTYRGEHSFTVMLGFNQTFGVGHIDDMLYLFDNNSPLKLTPNSDDEKMSKLFVSTVVQFATTGKPEFKHEKMVNWLPFSTEHQYWFNLNLQPELLQSPFKDRMEFWDHTWAKVKMS